MYMIVDDFRVVALRMSQHAIHEFGSLQPLDITGPVVDVGGGHELTTLFDTGNDDGIEVRTCSIDRRGVAGRSRAQDQTGDRGQPDLRLGQRVFKVACERHGVLGLV
jgi:hypothetical protein